MQRMASDTGASCKLSGLWNEAAPGARVEALRRHAEGLLGMFGASRLLWGSDWPVLALAGDYAAWFGLARALVPANDHAAVFGGNARAVYGV